MMGMMGGGNSINLMCSVWYMSTFLQQHGTSLKKIQLYIVLKLLQFSTLEQKLGFLVHCASVNSDFSCSTLNRSKATSTAPLGDWGQS